MAHRRWIGWALMALGAILAVNAVLGPLISETIRYRYSISMINQAVGLDAVALFIAAPMSFGAAFLTWKGRRSGPVLAMAPAAFMAYMAPQYIVGPDYLGLPGNNERFFLLHLGAFIVSVALLVVSWAAVGSKPLPPASRRSDGRRAWVLVGVAVFIALGRWLPAVIALTTGGAMPVDYRDNPTAFLLIGVLDLGLVTPAALAAAVGLWRGATWARKAAYAVIGWFSLVPVSVAAMAIAMVMRDDPNASLPAAVGFTVAAVIFSAVSVVLYWPLLEEEAAPVVAATREPSAVHSR